MAEKVSGRWEESFGADIGRIGQEGLRLTVTRKGVEVSGAYDSGYGGFETIEVEWHQLFRAKDRVDNGRAS